MALTKIGSIGINTGIKFAGVTTITTLNSATDTLTIGGPVSIAGTLTYEDVTNVDSVGLITARDGIVVGSGITLSKDGDGFFTGIVTATTFSGAFSGDGSALTGVANTDVIFTDKITLPDSSAGSINVGLGSDLQIYHTGSNSYIANTGTFRIGCTGSTNLKFFTSNNTRWNIDSSGHFVPDTDSQVDLGTNSVRVRNIYGDTLYGDGSNLTGVGITTEAASISGITTYLDLTKDDHELVVTGNNTISVIGGAQGTSHTLRLQNSGIATVTLDSTYFKFASGASPAFPTASGSISLVSFTVHKAGAVGVNTVLLTGASVNFS